MSNRSSRIRGGSGLGWSWDSRLRSGSEMCPSGVEIELDGSNADRNWWWVDLRFTSRLCLIPNKVFRMLDRLGLMGWARVDLLCCWGYPGRPIGLRGCI